jgi:hypothetical protein
MNRKLEAQVIQGSPNEKLFTIAKFHETRLGRIEQYLKEIENSFKTEKADPRVDTLEENLSVAFDSLQNLVHKVETDLHRVAALETKMNKMASKGSNTTKLAVMGEQLRLLSNKVENLVSTVSNNETGNDDEDTGSEEGEVVEEN